MIIKKILIILTFLSVQLTTCKFVDLFKKEQVETVFQIDGQQAKIGKKSLFQPEQPKEAEEHRDLHANITIVDMCSENITISEMFNAFSALIINKENICISEKKQTENNQPINMFFTQYASQLLLHVHQLHNRSWKHKQNHEKLVVMMSIYICLDYEKSIATPDSFIKAFDLAEQSLFPYIYFEKTLQKLIKTIKHTKIAKSIFSQKQILSIHKKLLQIKQQASQLPGYIYDKKMASEQTNFSTSFLPYRYNQLPFIDRTTLNYFNTQSGKPQHEIRHNITYAKK